MKNTFIFAASLMFFLLSSYTLTAQCVGNPRIDIQANYVINETDAGVFQIVGGFDNRLMTPNSLNYRFNITLQSAPTDFQNLTINFGNGQTRTFSFTQNDFPITRSFDIDYTSLGSQTVTVTTGPAVISLSQGFILTSSRVLAAPNYRRPTKTELITGASFSRSLHIFLNPCKSIHYN